MSKNILVPGRLARKITIEVQESGETKLVAQSFNSLGVQIPMEITDCACILAQILTSTVTQIKAIGDANAKKIH